MCRHETEIWVYDYDNLNEKRSVCFIRLLKCARRFLNNWMTLEMHFRQLHLLTVKCVQKLTIFLSASRVWDLLKRSSSLKKKVINRSWNQCCEGSRGTVSHISWSLTQHIYLSLQCNIKPVIFHYQTQLALPLNDFHLSYSSLIWNLAPTSSV